MRISLFIASLCAILNTSLLFADFNFFAISDIHVAADGTGGKIDQRNSIISLIDHAVVRTPLVLIPGDMTNTGSDEELAQLKNWLSPLNNALRKFDGHVYACLGNHDHCASHWYGYSDMVKFVVNSLSASPNANFYSFDIENLHFICCGKCPTDDGVSSCCKPNTLKQLADDLAENAAKKIILFWHYNIKGPMSGKEWWRESDKAKVYATLAPYYNNKPDDPNIIIFNGHCHNPQYTTSWGEARIPEALVGGSYFAVCEYKNMKDLNIYFMNAKGETKTWSQMYRENP